jgi:uncharacterized protein YcsI (UPF0317 family)
VSIDGTTLTAAQAGAAFRNGEVAPSAGWAPGHAQANLVSVPRDHAYDLLLFARAIPSPARCST